MTVITVDGKEHGMPGTAIYYDDANIKPDGSMEALVGVAVQGKEVTHLIVQQDQGWGISLTAKGVKPIQTPQGKIYVCPLVSSDLFRKGEFLDRDITGVALSAVINGLNKRKETFGDSGPPPPGEIIPERLLGALLESDEDHAAESIASELSGFSGVLRKHMQSYRNLPRDQRPDDGQDDHNKRV